MIAALAKADSLDRHLFGVGAKHLVSVTLSDREAWELLAWYQSNSIDYAPPEDREAFAHDLAEARSLNNPWGMLHGFEIRGFSIARLADEVH